MTGASIRCERCEGKGIVASWSFDGPMPDECPDCDGSGRNWQYPRGAIAKYYSGPLIGRARLRRRPLRSNGTSGERKTESSQLIAARVTK